MLSDNGKNRTCSTLIKRLNYAIKFDYLSNTLTTKIKYKTSVDKFKKKKTLYVPKDFVN